MKDEVLNAIKSNLKERYQINLLTVETFGRLLLRDVGYLLIKSYKSKARYRKGCYVLDIWKESENSVRVSFDSFRFSPKSIDKLDNCEASYSLATYSIDAIVDEVYAMLKKMPDTNLVEYIHLPSY